MNKAVQKVITEEKKKKEDGRTKCWCEVVYEFQWNKDDFG